MLKDGTFNILTRSFTVFILAAVSFVGSAHAQNSEKYDSETSKKVSRKIMRAGAGRAVNLTGRYGTDNAIAQKLSLPTLPGDQGFADSNDDPERFVQGQEGIPDFGANNAKNVNIILPPLKGLRQILDSSVTKDLLKELTAAESAVLMQTYMMVENGAATGFMGSMNIGSNLMSNLLQAQDYQLKLLDASDDTGKMKKAYVARVAQEMQNGANPDVWPAALYIASGEDGKKGDNTMKDLSAGQKPYDLSGLSSPSAGAGNSSSKDAQRLTELLFVNNTNSSGAKGYKNEQLDNLKKDFADLVGDIEIKMNAQGASTLARAMDLNFIPPSLDTDGKRRGVAAVNWQEVQVVWENIHVILFEYCTWKQSNPNKGKNIFSMETDTTTKQIGQDRGKGNPWELASSPDIPMTMNVIQMMYKMYEQTKSTPGINCSELKLEAKDIPDKESVHSESTNLNDCGKERGCLRNRVALQISYLVGRSRTLHTYRALFSIAGRFVTDQFTADLLARVSTRAFAGMNLDEELHNNYARYSEFVDYMAQLAQGNTGAGSLLRPGMNEAIQPGRN